MSIGLTSTNVGAQNTRNVLSGINVKTSKVFTGKSNHEDFTPEETVNVIVGVFFDGTANNKDNVNSRLDYERIKAHEKEVNGTILTAKETKAAREYKGTEQEKESAEEFEGWFGRTKSSKSYSNDQSNVARMESFYNDKTTEKLVQTHVYIEGAGTKNGSSDKVFGLALGTGGTGVRAKVKKACEKVADAVKKAASNLEVNKLIIDVYGFSRGAAEARNFVFEIYQKIGDVEDIIDLGDDESIVIEFKQAHGLLGKHLAQKGVEMKRKLEVRFAGLYDTVLSVGLPFYGIHKSNVKRLNMAAVNKASFVFQLASADEHRKNFKLTNIDSARGLEKTFPGVHSDIGGGYVDDATEKITLQKSLHLDKIKTEQADLILQGWFKPGQIPIKTRHNKHSTSYTLKGNRENLSNKYSFISLQIMSAFSVTKKVDILESKIKRKYSFEGDKTLDKAKVELDKYVNGDRDVLDFNNPTDKILLKTLRNEYFHWSSDYGSIGMKPHIENGKRIRQIFSV